MNEDLEKLYLEIKKQFVIDVLKIMKETCPNYITKEGEGFLDGIESSGVLPEYVLKTKYDELINKYNELLKKNKIKNKKSFLNRLSL